MLVFVSLSRVLVAPGHIFVLGSEGHECFLSPVPPGSRLPSAGGGRRLFSKGSFWCSSSGGPAGAARPFSIEPRACFVLAPGLAELTASSEEKNGAVSVSPSLPAAVCRRPPVSEVLGTQLCDDGTATCRLPLDVSSMNIR